MSTMDRKNVSLNELCELEIAVLRKFPLEHAKNRVIEFSDLEKLVASSYNGKINVSEAGVAILLLLRSGVLLEGVNGYKIEIKLSEHGKSLRSSLLSIEDIKRT